MSFSFGHVQSVQDLNPRLRRLRLEVPNLERLNLPGVADEAVGLYFPAPGQSTPPQMQERDGVWGFYDVDPLPEGRNYSIRHADLEARMVTIDFVIHAHGTATTWAAAATPGDTVAISHARSWYRPEESSAWQVLAADLAGLPALARILQEQPHIPTTAIVEVVEKSDLEYLDPLGDLGQVRIMPLIGSGNGYGESRLGAAVTDLTLPDGRGYCWFAGEAKQSRLARKHLRIQHSWHRDQYDIVGYWRFDGEAWAKRFANHGEDFLSVYQQAIAAGKSEKVAAEEFDEALERAGL